MVSQVTLYSSQGDERFREDHLQRLITVVRCLSYVPVYSLYLFGWRPASCHLVVGPMSTFYILYQAHCRCAGDVPASKSTRLKMLIQVQILVDVVKVLKEGLLTPMEVTLFCHRGCIAPLLA